jgi:hypothetical protein
MAKKGAAVAAFLFILAPANIFGQVATTGKITGVITDASGAVVPNAKVTASGSSLMSPRTTTSQGDGSYLFDFLPPGSYEVNITASGFKTFSQKNVVLTAGFTATVNARLEVGSSEQLVNVTAEAPAVDVKGNQGATTFDQSLLQNIPSGRDPWSTVAQTPGATISTVDVGGNQSYQQSTMQVHGSTPGEQLFSFNGLDLNWPGSNGGYTQFYTDHDALEEFQVISDNAPASVSIGGVYMNMVTKSGSNQLHGQAAAYYSTSAFQASADAPVFNGQSVNAGSPIVMDRDTAANLGGPLIKDRWWLFGSYRRYDLREDVLAVRQLNGQPTVDVNHQTNTSLRSDWQVNNRNRASFIWLYNEQNRFFRRDTAYQFVTPEASWLQIEPAYILEGLWTSQITTNFVMDFRFGYNKEVFPLGYQPTTALGAITVQDVTLSTESGAAPFNRVNPAWVRKFADTFSLFKGSLAGTHDFKFGFDVGKNSNPYIYSMNGGIHEQFNNGVPLDVVVYNTPFSEYTYFNDASIFLQDAWTIKRRLTLNLGLRYDRFTSYYPKETTSQNPNWPTLFPVTTFPASGNLVDWNNISPRIGVAYDFTGKGNSVLRFGYSRFYLMEGTQLVEAVNPNGLNSQTYTWNGAMANGLPTGFLSPSNLISKSGGVVSHLDPNLKRPYSTQINAGFQKLLRQDLVVGVNYYHRNKTNEIGRLNQAYTPADFSPITVLNGKAITNPLTGQPLTLYSLNPALVGQSNYLITNIPALNHNAYNGVELTGTKRMSHHWQLLAGFTIQRERGTYGAGFSDEALSDDFNNPNLGINRQNNYLNMDSTYVFKADSTYSLPKGFGVSVNFQHYTGFPIQPTQVFSGPELAQKTVTAILEPAGLARLPAINLLDMRISREFILGERYHVQAMADLFNLTNGQTVVSEVTSYGPNYLRPSNTVNPFLARFGLKFSF